MQRASIRIAAAALTLLTLCACAPAAAPAGDGLQIIATVFPAFDFARQVCGDDADVSQLLPAGVESHAYEPTARDIIAIEGCDLFICVGGESETWVDDLLSTMEEPVPVLRMIDCVDMVYESDNGEIEEEYDEHVWTSPANAVLIARAIADACADADPTRADAYAARCADYTKQLEELDRDFSELFDGAKSRVLVFGDRFPFRYFADRYSLECWSAYPGCGEQTEPSAQKLAMLTDIIKEHDIDTIFYIELSNHRVADALAEATGAQTALLHSCHNVSGTETDAGETYVSLMRQNLETLKEALY